MRVIITGGSGLIGSALTHNLAADGHEVIVLSRSPGAVEGLPANARAVGWDTRSADGWAHLADGADAIVNLAAENLAGLGRLPERWTPNKRERIRLSRIEAGRAVVDAVERAEIKPGAVIQASAVGYYGPRGDEIITEEAAAGDDFLANVCIEWEESTAPVEEHGVRRVIIRTGLVLSSQEGALPRVTFRYNLLGGGPFGDGRQWWSWIHLHDEARAIRFLVENGAASGPFNLAAPNPVRNSEFGKTLARIMNRPHYLPLPAFVMYALFGEVATVVVDGQRVVPEKLLDLGFEFRFPTLETALNHVLAEEI